ncbi:porphobilinogen synthase [Helicobacter mehlei]|uniref:Delta-aminolevulinic acid dehydratase n=1 Tax=Helicobacter mehlei TaxID=2316080 RepID=A0A553V180_9HELI|nr:porphobilinogen synthase [Helicobacter mehlei]TSA86257.1 porphobilinogen synthase [Helicobacter mehlei]
MFRRLRRLRSTENLRALVRETRLNIADFIAPLFVLEGAGVANPIASMPGVFQMSVDVILKECALLEDLGIQAVLLFGIPGHKDAQGSSALNADHIVAKATRAIKKEFSSLVVIADLCFCEYTDHGHCGILHDQSVDNDKTLEILDKQAVILAQSGVDVIAPSAMMDGMVYAIRQALDRQGFTHLPIMSYSTKFASSYYGPFRDVAQSSPSFGDRKSYQMDYANPREAILESLEDEVQGADILMVKPALAYLDIVHAIRKRTLLPLALYNVSGEYAMFKLAQAHNLMDYDRLLLETMTAFKRAGADMIISYHAKEVAQLLQKGF